jgi:hypothetical protein
MTLVLEVLDFTAQQLNRPHAAYFVEVGKKLMGVFPHRCEDHGVAVAKAIDSHSQPAAPQVHKGRLDSFQCSRYSSSAGMTSSSGKLRPMRNIV